MLNMNKMGVYNAIMCKDKNGLTYKLKCTCKLDDCNIIPRNYIINIYRFIVNMYYCIFHITIFKKQENKTKAKKEQRIRRVCGSDPKIRI